MCVSVCKCGGESTAMCMYFKLVVGAVVCMSVYLYDRMHMTCRRLHFVVCV